jgi:hypothetical protein
MLLASAIACIYKKYPSPFQVFPAHRTCFFSPCRYILLVNTTKFEEMFGLSSHGQLQKEKRAGHEDGPAFQFLEFETS